jgi:hypothetical protein
MMDNKSILIIGMSKTGKTHFGGQLYGRLKTGENEYTLRETPNDLSIFQDVLDRLNQGLEGKHTDSKLHETIVLPVVSKSAKKIDLIYPDYGGEQLRGIIEQRKVDAFWQHQITKSTNWFLFIRPDLIENIVDVTTKFYQQIEEEKAVKTNVVCIKDIPVDSSAFYVELLQIFLYIKGISLQNPNKPRLTVLLSCWDKSQYANGELPSNVLFEKMPLLYRFIHSNWNDNNQSIVGLSSLSRDLNSNNADKEFALQGPETFGYFIKENGEKEDDITILLNQVFL